MTAPRGTIPDPSLPAVQTFVGMFGLTDAPTILQCQDVGYDADFCHVSAKHHAIIHGGRRVHGWALWRFGDAVMGDFHSVWEVDGNLIDVTPPKFGESKVLFVRDRVTDIYCMENTFVFPMNRMSDPDRPYYFDGSPTDEVVWGIPADQEPLVAYARKLGFDLARLPTEPGQG